ncbi:MAG: insulinase family protein [Planctomycetota bacterium]
MLHATRLVAVQVLAVLAVAAAPAVAQDLPEDPRIVRGTLDNGMDYVVVPNAEPPGRVNLWLHVHSGSLNETEEQRGLAHFLEHMAFNGSTNFPPGTVVPFFQEMGLSFGRHQNAVTGFDRTGYTLTLPNTEDETIRRGMRFLSDVAYELLLLDSEIDKERSIILEERRAILSPQQRILYDLIERIAPGSTFGQRIPIGTEEVITQARRDRFVDYYQRWYVPTNMTAVVVGDIEPDAMVELVDEFFDRGPPAGRDARRPEPRPVGVTETEGYTAIIAADPEETREEVAINFIAPPGAPVTTEAGYRDDLVRSLALRMMNDRLDDAISQGRLGMLSGSVSSSDFAGAIRWTQAAGRAEPGSWSMVLQELGTEIRRATLHGFSERELEDARRDLIAAAERAAEAEPTLPSGAVLSIVTEALASGEPVPSGAQRLELVAEMAPTITLEEASERFAELFEFESAVFTLQTREDESLPSEEVLLGTGVMVVRTLFPPPFEEEARATAILDEQPEPGVIAERTLHQPTNVTSAWLGNGVRVHVRPMTEREEFVSVSVQLYGGLVFEDASNRGITDAAAIALQRPSGGGLSSTQIDDLLTGLKVGVGGGSGPDGLQLSISGSPADMQAGFELAHVLLTEPAIEQAAFDQWKRRQAQTLQTIDRVPQGVALKAILEAMFPEGEVRPRLLTTERLEALELDAAQAWLERAIAASPMEVAIVGDVDVETALGWAATYFGSLAERPRVSARTNRAERTIPRPEGPRVVRREPELATPQAFLVSGYYGVDEADIDDRRAMQMAARILSTRLIEKIREEEGLAYSPSAINRPATTFPGYGMFFVQAPTDPERVDELSAALGAMFDEFAADGPTSEEVEVAIGQLQNVHDESVRAPGYWLSRLRQAEYLGRSLDEVARTREAYAEFDAGAIREAFGRYHGEPNRIEVIVRPVSPEEAPDETDG